jgi:multidrug efflux system membrane fusion protein
MPNIPLSTAFKTAACFVALAGTIACSARGESSAQAPGGAGKGSSGRGSEVVPVSTGMVEQHSVPVDIRMIGTAEASTIVAVRAQVSGELTSVTFREGDDVQKGQVLFTLDRRPLEGALQQSQATLQRDIAQQTNARASAARYQDLLTRGIATREQADQSRASADALDATVAADKAAIENAKVQLAYATISAPISGRTGQLMVHLGNVVRANVDANPLVVINAISPINVSFGLPEGQLPDLKRYLARGTVRVSAAAPNEPTKSAGRITFIDNAVDQSTGQIKIKASFPNEDRRLWPGQFVNVIVTLTEDPKAIVVPTAAVQTGQQGSYVFVVQGQAVELRPIAVERQSGEVTVVKAGLKPGETVVTDGQLRLVSGSRVSIKPPVSSAKVEP